MGVVAAFAQQSTPSNAVNGGTIRLRIQAGPPLFHARNESVQKELRIDEETRRKLNELYASWGEQYGQIQAEQGKVSGLPEAERQAKNNELNKRRGELDFVTTKKFYSLLTEEQIVRFHGTFLQVHGIRALLRTDVGRWLEISEKQLKQLGDLETAYRRGTAELMNVTDSQENGRRHRELLEERERKGLEVLTEEQRKKLADAKGAPFEFKHNP